VDERIRYAARLMSSYDPSSIYVVASRIYASLAASKFAQVTGTNIMQGRFVPGRMTNPARSDFCEPKLLLVCDPKNERQAIREAAATGTPVIALCDTDNSTSYVDWVVPCNNKGKKSLSLVFFLLAREFMKAKNLISKDEEFGHSLEEFDVPIESAGGAEADILPEPAQGAPASEPTREEEPGKKKAGKEKRAGEEKAVGEEKEPQPEASPE